MKFEGPNITAGFFSGAWFRWRRHVKRYNDQH